MLHTTRQIMLLTVATVLLGKCSIASGEAELKPGEAEAFKFIRKCREEVKHMGNLLDSKTFWELEKKNRPTKIKVTWKASGGPWSVSSRHLGRYVYDHPDYDKGYGFKIDAEKNMIKFCTRDYWKKDDKLLNKYVERWYEIDLAKFTYELTEHGVSFNPNDGEENEIILSNGDTRVHLHCDLWRDFPEEKDSSLKPKLRRFVNKKMKKLMRNLLAHLNTVFGSKYLEKVVDNGVSLFDGDIPVVAKDIIPGANVETLTLKIKDLDSQIGDLKRKIWALEAKNMALETENKALEAKNKTVETKNKDNIMHHLDKIESLGVNLGRQRDINKGQKDIILRQRFSNKRLEAKYKTLETHNKVLGAKNKTLETKVKTIEAKNTTLETNFMILENKNKALQFKNKILEMKVETLETNITSL